MRCADCQTPMVSRACPGQVPEGHVRCYLGGRCDGCYRVAPPEQETVAAHRAFLAARAARASRRRGGRRPLHPAVTLDETSGLWQLWRHGVCVGLALTEDAAWTQLEARTTGAAA